jgi:hypothetical protein
MANPARAGGAHHRLTPCGPGSFDPALAAATLGWKATTRGWQR